MIMLVRCDAIKIHLTSCSVVLIEKGIPSPYFQDCATMGYVYLIPGHLMTKDIGAWNPLAMLQVTAAGKPKLGGRGDWIL